MLIIYKNEIPDWHRWHRCYFCLTDLYLFEQDVNWFPKYSNHPSDASYYFNCLSCKSYNPISLTNFTDCDSGYNEDCETKLVAEKPRQRYKISREDYLSFVTRRIRENKESKFPPELTTME